MSLRLMVGASPRLAPTMNFVHLRLKVIFSMFADCLQIFLKSQFSCLVPVFLVLLPSTCLSYTISITSI